MITIKIVPGRADTRTTNKCNPTVNEDSSRNVGAALVQHKDLPRWMRGSEDQMGLAARHATFIWFFYIFHVLFRWPLTRKSMYIYNYKGIYSKRVQGSFIGYNNDGVVSNMYSTDGQSLCIMRKGIRFSFQSTLRFAQRNPHRDILFIVLRFDMTGKRWIFLFIRKCTKFHPNFTGMCLQKVRKSNHIALVFV